ncbi:MAG: ligand-binding protein SH3 [Desulfobacteraceae bacterium]|nr:ligand-binding protein SH3 [Desulfobacteraceae bacterium]
MTNRTKISSKSYRVIKNYVSPYPDPIRFSKGERVKVSDRFTDDPDWNDWVWCEGANQNAAWVPDQYVDHDGDISVMDRNYNAMELTVRVDDILLVHDIVNGFAMAEKQDGKQGWVPMKHVEKL